MLVQIVLLFMEYVLIIQTSPVSFAPNQEQTQTIESAKQSNAQLVSELSVSTQFTDALSRLSSLELGDELCAQIGVREVDASPENLGPAKEETEKENNIRIKPLSTAAAGSKRGQMRPTTIERQCALYYDSDYSGCDSPIRRPESMGKFETNLNFLNIFII